jgi:aminoglycoside phosphotransferase (APT) family kinase protein
MSSSDIEQTARRYVPGTGAIALDRLGSGLVNESYRAVRDGLRYSLRVPAPHGVELGTDRAWECRVLERATAAGIAPRIVCCEPREGLLLAHWVEGSAWTLEQARQQGNIEKFASLVRRVHALATPAAPRIMSPAGWVAYYRAALARRGADAAHPLGSERRRLDLKIPLEWRLAALGALPPRPPVLCHSDLHVQNLVAGTGGLVLLDWEYSHVSEAFWDLAGWACNNDLSAESRRLLLTSYLGRQPTGEDAVRLEHLAWLYDYVCVLWSELYLDSRGSREGDGILGRAELLVGRLRRDSGGRAG